MLLTCLISLHDSAFLNLNYNTQLLLMTTFFRITAYRRNGTFYAGKKMIVPGMTCRMCPPHQYYTAFCAPGKAGSRILRLASRRGKVWDRLYRFALAGKMQEKGCACVMEASRGATEASSRLTEASRGKTGASSHLTMASRGKTGASSRLTMASRGKTGASSRLTEASRDAVVEPAVGPITELPPRIPPMRGAGCPDSSGAGAPIMHIFAIDKR
jgi:hypothetical protein